MPGYTLSKNGTVDSRYLCLLCQNILKDPVQTGCGHVYCISCISDLKRDDGTYTCLVDKTPFAADQKHRSTCPEEKERCSNHNCDEGVKRSDLQRHQEHECLYRTQRCPLCDDLMTAAVLKTHQIQDCKKTKLLNSRLSEVSHNFTTVEACTLKVVIHGFHNGEYCSGVAKKDLLFKAHLVIVGLPGPKLPSDQEKVAINVPARFEVKFKDPFKAVTNVSTDWDFGDGSLVTERNSCLIFHTYRAEIEYHVWVTVRVET
ncbi:TNF receptor-associated factor 5, partial [Stylophora pistillata]